MPASGVRLSAYSHLRRTARPAPAAPASPWRRICRGGGIDARDATMLQLPAAPVLPGMP